MQADRIFVRDGRFWRSAGIAAGIDLALALVANDPGEPVARRVAQQSVMPYRRSGGQSQCSPMLELARPQGRFTAVLEHVRADLAARACMSTRHFARAFAAETDNTPAQAVERIRAEVARAAPHGSGLGVQQVARQCGYTSNEHMRRSFVHLVGMPSSALRRL